MKRSIELLEVDALKPAVRNPKDHDLGELMTSIERFGFVDAVVLDERSGRLVAGHGRVEALQAMKKDGKPAPRGVTVDDDGRWLLPVQRGWASKDDREAEAFIVASNRLVEVGGWDSNALTELLADLAKSGADALSGIGYDADDVDRLLAAPPVVMGSTDPRAEWEGMPEFNQEDKTAFRSLVVHFKDQAAVDAFAALVKQTLTEKTKSMRFPPEEPTVPVRYE